MYLSHSLCIQCTHFVTIKALTLKAIPFIIINSNITCISTCTMLLRNICPKFACERHVHNLCICICVWVCVHLWHFWLVYCIHKLAYCLLIALILWLFLADFNCKSMDLKQWIILRFGQLRNCVPVTIRLSTYSVTQTVEQVRIISTKWILG